MIEKEEGRNMKSEKKLKELQRDLFATLFAKPKKKRLRPFIKQLTYKGVTVKWSEDGNGYFLDFVGKTKLSYEFLVIEGETNKEFVKRMIDEGRVR